jgi:hypothetical protein
MAFEQIEKISDGCRRMKIRVGGCKGRNMGSQRSTQFESQISHSRDRYIESSSSMRNLKGFWSTFACDQRQDQHSKQHSTSLQHS